MIEDVANQVSREVNRQVELALVTAIEKIEGRVPTDKEVSFFGKHLIFPDNHQEWTWKGIVIIRMEPLDFSGRSSLIKMVTYQ